MPHLLIQNGNGEPQRYALSGDRVTVGRYPDNSLVLDDGSVSGHHAEITQNDGLCTLRDIGSSNGTTVNGEAVKQRALRDGDTVAFGRVECRFSATGVSAAHVVEPAPTPIPDSASPSSEKADRESFSSKLSAFGTAALGEAKRAAQIAALKAKVEKLKMVDLHKAHHALGKKCYEMGLLREQMASQFAAIAEVEQRIGSKRQNIVSPDQETAGDKIKRLAHQTKREVEAEALGLRLKQLLTELGKQIATLADLPPDIEADRSAIESVNVAVRNHEEEIMRLKADGKGLRKLNTLSRSMWADCGHHFRKSLSKGAKVIREQPKIALLLCVFLVVAIFSSMKLIQWRNEKLQNQLEAQRYLEDQRRREQEIARRPPSFESTHYGFSEDDLRRAYEKAKETGLAQ